MQTSTSRFLLGKGLFQTDIQPEIVDAYLQADYVVYDKIPFLLKVGHKSANLTKLYNRYGVDSCTFITSCNPLGCLLDTKTNADRLCKLKEQVSIKGYHMVNGKGEDPQKQWPGEESILILGISRDEAENLGNQYEQNAVIIAGKDSVSMLVLLK